MSPDEEYAGSARLRAAEEAAMHSQVLMAMKEGAHFVDANGVIRFVNPALAAMFGYEAEELLGQHVSILNDGSSEEQAARAAEIFGALQATGEFDGIVRNRRKDGSVLWTHLRVTPFARQGEVFWVSVQEDITEQRAAEEEVRRARDLLRQVIDSSPDLIFVKDTESRFLMVNEAFARLRNSTTAEMLGRKDREFASARHFDGDPATGVRGFREHDRQVFDGGTVRDTNMVVEQGGELRVFDVHKMPLRDAHGAIYALLAYAHDVTEERAAAERRRRALEEKETLLREIHHRVKNNLQIISGLMYFQAKRVHDPRDASAFSEGRTRLLAMMLVHDKLYQSEDLSQVDLGDYARALVSALVSSLEVGSRVTVGLDLDSLRLPAGTALSVGMILCELLTNVYKHSMAGRASGRADVRLRSDGETARIEVHDDGIGFPEDFDLLATSTFGWHLVREIVAQLGGEVTTSNDQGALVRVSFPLPSKGAT